MVQTGCRVPHADPGAARGTASGAFGPRYSEESSQAEGEAEGNIWKQQLAAEGSARNKRRAAGRHTPGGRAAVHGGSIWALIWGYNLPRVLRGTNLLRPSSEAELPIISVSHQARGTRQTVPTLAGAVSPKRAVGQLRAMRLRNKASFFSSGAREGHLSQFF